MNKLWKKTDSSLNPIIEQYTVGEDYRLDKAIMTFDIQASKAHAKGLQRIGILDDDELKLLLGGLDKLDKDFADGKVNIEISDEDCHTVIENYLTAELGEVGKKIHTGRSRNDQVLVAMRLYMLEQIRQVKSLSIELTEAFLDFAKKYKNIPLPGYTHTQQAMLSSVGHYASSFVESLLDDIDLLDAVTQLINKSPLGSAAGFGVALPLDRHGVATELGFNDVQINSLYCQSSRGKVESLFMESLSQIMLSLARFANDMILFTSQEFSFFSMDNSLVTGSSIMPQKRNPDAMEILRGNLSLVLSDHEKIRLICKNLLSGYNRDLQLIKEPVMRSAKLVTDSLEVVTIFLDGITPDQEQITTKITKDMFMADLAYEMVKEDKIPFRTAYQQAAEKMDSYEVDFQANIASKISIGAAGNLQLDVYRKRLDQHS